jgi:uncharacterized protein YijF (DUF1287 family)
MAGGEAHGIVDSARRQVGLTLYYDPSYVKLDYPMGDVPLDRGVCTDVVIRSLRKIGMDLQKLIHEDRLVHPSRYAGLYSGKKPDYNIDHRRVKNIQAYLASRGYRVSGPFEPGDIVVWKLPISGLDHIGICSDKRGSSGELMVIHNIGAGTKEEDVLYDYRIVDHFRISGMKKRR